MANKQNKKPIQKPVAQAKPAEQNKAGAQKSAVPKEKYSLTLKLCLFLGILSLVVYANTLKNGFVLDDDSAITENTIVSKGVSAIPEILSTPYRRGYFVTSNDLYRPLSLVLFAAEYSAFEKNPMPYHFFTILIFAGCVILLFLFLDKLFERKRTGLAFMAALLFALHPIHTEVVANIKSCDELLCFFFAFLSLNIFVKYMQEGKMTQLLLGCACFFLSMLSKETVITMRAVIPLIFFFYLNNDKKRSTYITVSVFIVAAIALAIRFSVLSAYGANGMSDIDFADNGLALKTLAPSSRIATAVLILGDYLKLLFVPYPLVSDYAYATIPFVTFANIGVLLSLAAYLFLGVFAIMRFMKDKKDPYAFAIFFFLVPISLFSNIIFLIGSTMAERFLFFSSVGFCLAVALVLEKLAKNDDVLSMVKKPLIAGILIPVGLIYAGITINRNSDWLDNYTLYSTDVKHSSNSAKLNYFVGLELQKTVAEKEKDPVKQLEIRKEGIDYLKKALGIDSNLYNAQSDIGNAYFLLKMYDSAEKHEARALALDPNGANANINLSNVYYAEQKYRQAIDLGLKAVAVKPDYVNCYANLGRYYLALGRPDSGIYYTQRGIAIDPNYGFNYKIMAFCFKAIGNADSVRKYVGLAQKTMPDFNL